MIQNAYIKQLRNARRRNAVRRDLKVGFTSHLMSVAICAIVKDEELYIHEWIQYHLKMGFDHIYLYDNSNNQTQPSLAEVLNGNYTEQLTVYSCPGECMQLQAYYHFIQTHRNDHTWCAFIDIDEFIVIRQVMSCPLNREGNKKRLVEFMNAHCNEGSLALNWVLFGSNEHKVYHPRPVLQRFTKRQLGVNEHTKNIVRLRDVVHMKDPHTPELHHGNIQDVAGNIITGPYNYHPKCSDKVACIFHYFTKSVEEFQRKIARGRADLAEKRDFARDFARHDLNEVIDYTAYAFSTSTIPTSPNASSASIVGPSLEPEPRAEAPG